MKKIIFLLLLLGFTITSCITVVHEHHCRIVSKVYHEPYSIIKYRTTSDGGIIPVKKNIDEKYVLILYSIELNKTIKHEVDQEFYEKFNSGDTVLFYYEKTHLKTNKYRSLKPIKTL